MLTKQQLFRKVSNALDTLFEYENVRTKRAPQQWRERIESRQAQHRTDILDTLVGLYEERDRQQAQEQVLMARLRKAEEERDHFKRLAYSAAYGGRPAFGLDRGTEGVPKARPEYTGHGVNTGGLQAHSIGDEYPYLPYMRGNSWRILDTRTGNTHHSVFPTAARASEVAKFWAGLDKRSGNTNVRIGRDGVFTSNQSFWKEAA